MPLSEIKRMAAAIAQAPTPTPPAETPYVPNPDMKNTDTVEVPNFPKEVLPPMFRTIADDCTKHLSFPHEFTCVSMIGAVAVAMGRTQHLRWRWNSGGCIFLALVAPPGTAKSHPLSFCLKPIIQRDKKNRKEYQDRVTMAAMEGVPTDGLKKKQILYSDFTIESLIDGLRRNQRGIAVYLDELRAWVNNFNRYNAGSEQEFWLTNWSGEYMAVDRKTSSASIQHSDISVVGTIQPGLLDDIGKGGRANAGFVERILFCYPNKVPVMKFKKKAELNQSAFFDLQQAWDRILCKILDTDQLDPTAENADERRHILDFTDEADDLATEYINLLKDELERHDNEFIRNVYSKMQTYFLRFCLILQNMHVAAGDIGYDPFDRPNASGDASWIGPPIVDKAVLLTDYFLKHSLKAVSVINNVTPLAKMPTNLLNWYRELPLIFTTQEAETVGVKHGITRRTMFIHLNQQEGNKRIFQKIKHGQYEKLFV